MDNPSELRLRMIESMLLHGLAPTTQETYIRCVRNLAAYYHRSPDQLGEPEIRRFFLYLINERKLAEGSFRTHRFAIKFLYEVSSGAKCRFLPTSIRPRDTGTAPDLAWFLIQGSGGGGNSCRSSLPLLRA